ncbi:hypothetical protein RSOL_306640 [Rhizoctonia solani AG-3 Rhs1AP]|uniref:Uncharacterized protein n=1 Tax=Rhizoctonia solani AG-3 Rhs1AP TaxID=1086054 RepID=A0A0A1UJJ6_9AGAM|nr:hypothetical protein RSOL_306640 [Rhizoctonia solani AG-3 Rhs1AP]
MVTDTPVSAVGEPQPPAAPQGSVQGSSQPPPPLPSSSNPGPSASTDDEELRARMTDVRLHVRASRPSRRQGRGGAPTS